MSPPRPIPEALLERYLAGDLEPALKAQLDQALANGAPERARLEALRADSAAFLVQHPPGKLAARIETARPRPRWLWWLGTSLAGAAATLLAVTFARQKPTDDEMMVKGTVALSAYRQTETTAQPLLPGATLKSGDHLRFEVRAPKDGWVAVLSRDGAGHVTVYYPYGGTAAARYSALDPMLPGAIGLDQTLGPETVWLLYGSKPFALDEHLATLQRGGMLVSTPELTVSRLGWTKQ